MAFTTESIDHLIRANLWSSDLIEIQEHELMGLKYVKMITDLPDGDTLNIPSIGQMEAQDYAENQPVVYTAMDTGNFTFTIAKYRSVATYVTNKMKQDSYVMNQVVSQFVPKMNRAIMARMEAEIMAVGPNGQTAADSNTINGAKHRFVGSGSNETIDVTDFMKAKYALQRAAAPMTNLVAIVDPSVEYELATLPNLVNFSNNPQWEGVVTTGISTGMRFVKNIYGFDVYTSEFLKVNTTSEAIDGVTAAAGVNNLFFTAAGDACPFIGAVRQPVKVDSSYNKDHQRDEYVTTCRYDFALLRPENLVVVLTDTDRVYS